MPRFEDTPGLFGGGAEVATPGNITCDLCGTKYLDREDEEGNPLPSSEDILSAKFGDLVVVECCFGRVEEAVFYRIDEIIPWFLRILTTDSQILKQREGMIVGLYKVLGDLLPR